MNAFIFYLNLFNLNALLTTDTELNPIASPAIIGFSKCPVNRYSKPPAIGIPQLL